MRTMPTIIRIIPGNLPTIRHEIIPVNVIGISIAVVIHTGCSVQLFLIDPHIGGQIFVIIHHPLIHHGHNDRRIARAQLPGRLQIDIGTGFDRLHQAFIARILVVPLIFQTGVVKFSHHINTRIRRNIVPTPNLIVRDRLLAVIIFDNPVVILHIGNLVRRSQLAGRRSQRNLRVEFHNIPKVQTESTRLSLMLRNIGENPLERYGLDIRQSRVEALKPRTGRLGTGHPRFHGSNRFIAEFNQQFPLLRFE